MTKDYERYLDKLGIRGEENRDAVKDYVRELLTIAIIRLNKSETDD